MKKIIYSLSFFVFISSTSAKQLCISGIDTFGEIENLKEAIEDSDQALLEEKLTEEFYDLINEERKKDLEEWSKTSCMKMDHKLKRNPVLDQVAMKHCKYIASIYDPRKCGKNDGSQSYVKCMQEALSKSRTHVDSSGNNESMQALNAKFCKPMGKGYVGCNLTANVSASGRPLESASIPPIVAGYMNSPDHKKNILNRLNNETGVAVCTSPYGGVFTDQIFANTRKYGEGQYTKIPDCTAKPIPIEY